MVTQVMVLSHLDYCSGIAKKDISKLQTAQNKAARVTLACLSGVRQSTENMYVELSWLRVDIRSTCYHLNFLRHVCHSNQPNCL